MTERSVFLAALDRPDPAVRAAYLDEACAADPALRRRVDALLAVAASETFMARPAAPAGPTLGPPDGPDPAAAALPPDPPGYRLVGEIARGGMGVVYRAADPGFGREVAVKVAGGRPGAAAARRFAAEARITGRLQHPGIPPAHAAGELADGRPYLVMKLVGGRTLAALLDDRPSPAADRPRWVRVFEQVCQAVAYAHAEGVVHRDLKPSNVMVGSFGEVQVMDWGLAKVLASRERERPECVAPVAHAPGSPDDPDATTAPDTPEADDRTRAGVGMGTPAYMPPEQANGAWDRVDARADVFALGGILCAVLTGRPAYTGAGSAEVFRLARAGDVADARARLAGCGADAELVAVAVRCLDPDPAGRPADARAVADQVAAYRAGVEDRLRRAEADRAAADARAAEGRKRRRVQRLLLAAAGLLVAGAAGVGWREDNRAGARRAEAAAAEARARQAVESAVALAAGLWDQFRFADARAALDHAAGLVPADAPADVADRLARAGDDLELVRRLDAIRLGRLRVDIVAGGEAIGAEYLAAFRTRGVDPSADDPEGVAGWVAGSPVRRHLLAAIDDWAIWDERPGASDRLWAVTRRIDPGAWSDRLRDLAVRPDREAVGRLAAEVRVADLPPHLLVLLYQAPGPWPGSTAALAEATARHPGDFWVQLEAGYYFMFKVDDPAAAAGHLRAALAVRPGVPYALLRLGDCLDRLGDADGAAAARRGAARLDPEAAPAAEAAAGPAATTDRALAAAHLLVGNALWNADDRAGAMAAYRAAVKADPGHAPARLELGDGLTAAKEWAEAAAAYREAGRLRPWDDRPFTSLGRVLTAWGDAAGAAAAHRRAARNRSADPAADPAVVAADREAALAARLPAVKTGADRPADPAEAVALAEVAVRPFVHEYETATRLYADAFAADPQLEGTYPYRYNAACGAARAAAGDDPAAVVGWDEWGVLQDRAFVWLAAELAGLRRRAAGDPDARAAAAAILADWFTDPDLASVRDPARRGWMPAADRDRWAAFWAAAEEVQRAALVAVAPPPREAGR